MTSLSAKPKAPQAGLERPETSAPPGDGDVIDFAGRQYLTQPALASKLGKSVRTLERWHVRRIGPPRIKIGTLVLYPVDELPGWLARHQSAAMALPHFHTRAADSPAGSVRQASRPVGRCQHRAIARPSPRQPSGEPSTDKPGCADV